MVVAALPIIVEDPFVARRLRFEPEVVASEDEPFFLDGPVAARVAVIDRDPFTGNLSKPVQWSETSREFALPAEPFSREAMAVSVFATVLQTLAVFERPDVLGHPVRWAFDSPQLLVVPRAGIWANAFYDRYSQSIQFFGFDPEATSAAALAAGDAAIGGADAYSPGQAHQGWVHTALSRDIVAHETGHAIVDALAPALYDALSPQSLALHESLADLTALVMALQSRRVRQWLVDHNNGRLDGDTLVSDIATEFGWAQRWRRPLRNANNSTTLAEAGDRPHAMSEVLTGAIWAAMVHLHQARLDVAGKGTRPAPPGQVLAGSAWEIARIVFRALDYLPPAEATFADYARALLRADTLAQGDDPTGYRDVLLDQLRRRGIVEGVEHLHGPARRPPSSRAAGADELDVDLDNLDDLVESEWAAYTFAERHRRILGIPARAPLRLFPRRDVRRRHHRAGEQAGEQAVEREVVFQVTWEVEEPNPPQPGLPARRAVFRGTTLVLGGDPLPSGRYPVRSLLSSDPAMIHVEARSRAVAALAGGGVLRLVDRRQAAGRRPAGRPLEPTVFGRVTGNVLRLRGTARLLHLAGAAAHPAGWRAYGT